MTKAKTKSRRVWPPRTPTDIDNETWFYEERKGLFVVRQLRNPKCVLVQGDSFCLPWRAIEQAVDRRRAAKRRAKR